MKNRTIMVDLSNMHESEIAPVIIGAANAVNAPFYWGTGGLHLALNPAIGAHRELENTLREANLRVRG